VVDVDKWDGIAIARVTHSGGGNFALWNYSASGEKIDLLINTIGNYSGTVVLDAMADEHTARFEVTARGDWTIDVLPLDKVRTVDTPGAIMGTGDDVVLLLGPRRPDTLTIDASTAKRNFSIWAYGNGRDLLVNDISPYTGTVVVASDLTTRSGNLLLVIAATGDWVILVKAK